MEHDLMVVVTPIYRKFASRVVFHIESCAIVFPIQQGDAFSKKREELFEGRSGWI